MKRIFPLLLPLAVACSENAATSRLIEPGAARANVAAAETAIPDEYIVVFRSDVTNVSDLARQIAAAQGATVQFIYQSALKGFAARMSTSAADAIARNPNVSYVEQDQVANAIASETLANGQPWGIDRIDARWGLDATYNYSLTGAGVTAYIIDTGIRTTHSEFGGRASGGYTAVADGNGTNDCNGHGTHVSGTVGGATYGVAKSVALVAVRVLDCSGSGSVSGVVAGIDWVTANHHGPSVANMSLGGGASTSLDDAVRNSIASGVAYAIAAGNGNFAGIAQDACNYSPARVTEAMTVGATSTSDTKASWSNYGDCVDWFAPGVSILSAWNTSDVATNTISGTSMATPHTTGVAALYLQANPSATPQQVRDGLFNASTKGIVASSSTTNNDLLYSPPGGFGGSTTTNNPPTASFTYSCSDLACTFTDGSTDSDGTIASWNWNFGDGSTSTATNPSHTYASASTYTVALTVTDNAGAQGTTSQAVTVTSSTSSITGSLTVSAGTKAKGTTAVSLAWIGLPTGQATILRNNSAVGNVDSSVGTFTDSVKGRGTFTYQVCVPSANTCTPTATISF